MGEDLRFRLVTKAHKWMWSLIRHPRQQKRAELSGPGPSDDERIGHELSQWQLITASGPIHRQVTSGWFSRLFTMDHISHGDSGGRRSN